MMAPAEQVQFHEQVQAIDKVAAIVILYLPSDRTLARLLQSLKGTVNQICVVDNTPKQQISWVNDAWFREQGLAVNYQALGDNLGIAKAQNVGIEMAMQTGCDHVILFDQDSEASPEMVVTLLAAELLLLSQGVKVGSVGPSFIDEKTGDYASKVKKSDFFATRTPIYASDAQAIKVDHLIASGSLIRTCVFQEVGGMLDELFIDWVDIEWCLRASRSAYAHFMIPKTVMHHKIGDDFVDIGVRKFNIHSDIRKFYIIRNGCFLLGRKNMQLKFLLHTALKIPAYIVIYLFVAKNKIKLLKLILTAVKHGFSGRLGKADVSI